MVRVELRFVGRSRLAGRTRRSGGCRCAPRIAVALSVVALVGCSEPSEERASAVASADGERVEPPFPVRGELEGLLLTWFDAEGSHLAQRRADVPESFRAMVRVDSLALPPEARDPDVVFVADLRAPGPDGAYPVVRMTRAAFEARVREARRGAGGPAEGSGGSDEIVVFGASWCGACRQAEEYLRQRGVAFVERDIERDPAAREDMMRRARAAGIAGSGIPIIDVRGRVLQGFDAAAIDRALRETERGSGGASSPAPSGGTTI